MHLGPKIRHRPAVIVDDHLLPGTLGRIHRATEEEERAAFDHFKRDDDQDMGLALNEF